MLGRVRMNGTLIPINSFDRGSLSRLDMRVQKRFSIGRVALDGMLEVFNLFNRTNYGSWVENESNARFGQPSDNNNIASSRGCCSSASARHFDLNGPQDTEVLLGYSFSRYT